MSEETKKVEPTAPIETIVCPWGCGKVPRKEYADHLTKVHYEKKGEKILGPFPAKRKKEE